MSQKEDENTNARRAWNTNAEFWDQRMVEGNDFFNVLVWPAVEKLLRPSEGDRLLDVACGNGVTSRRLANAKARVTAFDFLQPMIDLARKRDGQSNIDYRQSTRPTAKRCLNLESLLSTVRFAIWR